MPIVPFLTLKQSQVVSSIYLKHKAEKLGEIEKQLVNGRFFY